MANILKKGMSINETYTVEFFIGEGAFGEVYRVKHKYFNEYQVMKVFKPEYTMNTDLKEIMIEAQILAHLTHPNIVRVFAANQFFLGGLSYYFLTMSFVSGESLSQLISRKMQLDVATTVSIITDVLQGLKVAHEHSPMIVHRDINPDNILLAYDGPKPTGLLG
ncbi:MAG: protein kinase, partial [Candidatus Brocadiales bacterium]|nr:protein kinase [Candidatus Brocadiales bacterium]